MSDRPPPRTGRGVLVGAITATALAIVFFNLMLLFFVRWQQAAGGIHTATPQSFGPATDRRSAPGEFSFADLQDSDVAGRYRYYELTNLMGTIKLLPDHTIINKDGTKYPRHYWEIQPEGILTRWQRATWCSTSGRDRVSTWRGAATGLIIDGSRRSTIPRKSSGATICRISARRRR